jgi:endonuclease/exonuclease/phosphatase family metal-dependent hydrolase
MANALVVLTQNAWGAAPLWTRRRARLARSIADVEPDVVGLQEIHAPTTRGDESQAHELAAELGGYQVLFAPGRVTSSGACEGVALLVRAGLEIADHAAWKLSVDAGDALDAPHQRVVLRAMVRQRALVDVFVTHLSLSKRARERTIGELVIFAAEERRASRSAGAVLVGDLNAAPHEPALAQLDAAGWVDAWDRANPEGSGATWPAAVPFRRLDYVWAQLGAGWQVEECRRSPVAGSDHVGLWARFTWPDGGG